jgi:hypothetical protein
MGEGFEGRLTENDVVASVARFLERRGARVTQMLTTRQHGVDIKAILANGAQLWVEAKGASSSKRGSKNYKTGFTKSQRRDHFANALLSALQMLTHQESPRTGIAVPEEHRYLVNPILPLLTKLGIIVFLVRFDESVELVGSVEQLD